MIYDYYSRDIRLIAIGMVLEQFVPTQDWVNRATKVIRSLTGVKDNTSPVLIEFKQDKNPDSKIPEVYAHEVTDSLRTLKDQIEESIRHEVSAQFKKIIADYKAKVNNQLTELESVAKEIES